MRLSERQEEFCRLVVAGEFTESDCYAKVFQCAPKSARASASRLMANEYVRDRISRLRQIAAAPRHAEIKAKVTEEFQGAIVEAVLHSDEVQHIINGVVTKLKRISATLLTVAERRSFLAAIVRTPIGQIDENSPLAQSVEYELKGASRDQEGRMVMKVKTPDKIRASELDAKMAGELVESGTTVNVTENKAIVVMLPAAIAAPRRVARVVEAEDSL